MPSPEESYLIVDIETIPDAGLWSRPETPLGKEPPFPPTYAHRVITIGCMWLDPNYRMRKLGVIGKSDGSSGIPDERVILEDLSRFIDKNRPSLVTYNGRTFDLPVIALRSLHNGITMRWYYERGLRYRYSESGHIDLCDWLADHGAARSASLDALARLIGLPGKLGVDGSQIEGLYRAGRIQTIENYCLSDVVQTAMLFLRFRLLQGVLSKRDYVDTVRALTDELGADDRIEELMTAIDGDRLISAASAA